MPNSNELWDVDVRHLAALVAIARTKSLSKAAEELGFGQSAVSQQLAALERIVGQRLVDRGSGPRPVTLTAAGASLLGHANAVLERLATARLELDRLATGVSGKVRVGTFQSAGARLLPSVLVRFRKLWPGISVQLHEGDNDGDLTARVLGGGLDIAFLQLSQSTPGMAVVELLRDTYVALVPPGHRFSERESLRLEEFAGEEFVGGTENDPCTASAERALRSAGVDLNVVFRTDENTALQRLVAAGLGVAISPALTIEPSLSDGAISVPLVGDLHRIIGLGWSSERTLSQAAIAFRDVAVETLNELHQNGTASKPVG